MTRLHRHILRRFFGFGFAVYVVTLGGLHRQHQQRFRVRSDPLGLADRVASSDRVVLEGDRNLDQEFLRALNEVEQIGCDLAPETHRFYQQLRSGPVVTDR